MMMRNRSIHLGVFIVMYLLGGNVRSSLAQERLSDPDGLSDGRFAYQLRAGVNVGGFSPLPLPAEIRKINSFSPKLNFSVEGNVTYMFTQSPRSWGIKSGIRLENKAMETDARVKNYSMEIIGEKGERVAGNWTGGVSTQVTNSYLTVPIVVTGALGDKWGYSFGTFWSFLLEKEFSGYVYDGYLREGGAIGNKVVFSDDKTAAYNFSDDLRNFSYGLQVGGYWNASRHLDIFTDLTFGMNDIFKSDFKTVSFAMRPIYLSIGFGYNF